MFFRWNRISVTRWSDYFSVFGHLQQWNLAQKWHKFVKVGSAICRVKNKPSKICQRFVSFCQSGKISPNLIPLVVTRSTNLPRAKRNVAAPNCKFVAQQEAEPGLKSCQTKMTQWLVPNSTFVTSFDKYFIFRFVERKIIVTSCQNSNSKFKTVNLFTRMEIYQNIFFVLSVTY